MQNPQMPAPDPTHGGILPETPPDGFTEFFRKAKALGCFPRATDTPVSRIFDAREPRHAEGNVPITGKGTRSVWASLSAAPIHDAQAACIHVPSGTAPMPKELSAAYAEAVICEIMRDGALARRQGLPIQALFIGGDAPTALAPTDLGRIIEAARSALPLTSDCEITVQGRVADLTPEMMGACVDAGANRVSLNIQSFQTALRRSLGRRSHREEVMEALAALKATGRVAVSATLQYGLPGQTPEMWQEDITTLMNTEPDGIGLPPFHPTREPPVGEATPAVPDLTGQFALFQQGVTAMADRNYRRLSADHWAVTPRERNLYASLVSQGCPCLPFGAGAVGRLAGHRVTLSPGLTEYLATVGTEKPIDRIIPPKGNHHLMAYISGQMATRALDLDRLGRTFGETLPMVILPLVHCWIEAKLVRIDGHTLRPTPAGEFWQANLTRGLMDYLTCYRDMGCPEPCV